MNIEDILKLVPIDDIAQKLGVGKEQAEQAVAEGSAVLLGGLAKNAATPEGSAAIEKALGKHAGAAGAASVSDIDEADGEKIVKHVFGDDEQKVAAALSSETKSSGIDFAKLLPMLAPIVMGLLANKSQGGSAGTAEASSGGGIGDILGGILGGGSNNSGGGIGDVLGGLGGLLGGGGNNDSGGGLGGLLGGLFGGNK